MSVPRKASSYSNSRQGPASNPRQPNHSLCNALIMLSRSKQICFNSASRTPNRHLSSSAVSKHCLGRVWYVQRTGPRTLAAASQRQSPIMADNAQKELLQLTQQMLDAIANGDYATYERMCSPDLTCFEPEAVGYLVTGMPFHKFYFDNLPHPQRNPEKPGVVTTIVNPKVLLMAGGQAAVVTYVRLTQKMIGDAPTTTRAEETRVWEKIDGQWLHIHFHRSTCPA